MPPRFTEVRLLRNLLVHGSQYPSEEVGQYLFFFNSSVGSSKFTNRDDHLDLARMRSAHLLSAVWQIVINDVVGSNHAFRVNEHATHGGIILIDQGPSRSIVGIDEDPTMSCVTTQPRHLPEPPPQGDLLRWASLAAR